MEGVGKAVMPDHQDLVARLVVLDHRVPLDQPDQEVSNAYHDDDVTCMIIVYNACHH